MADQPLPDGWIRADGRALAANAHRVLADTLGNTWQDADGNTYDLGGPCGCRSSEGVRKAW